MSNPMSNPMSQPCTEFNGSLIYNPETVTVVRIENREGEVRNFTLKTLCDKPHVSYGLYDSDYDYTTLAFEHEDVSSEPCLGTWFAPGY